MQKSPQQRFLLILGVVMFAVYLILGCMLIFGKTVLSELGSPYRYLLGALLIVYAAIRFIRVINPKEEQ